MSNLASFAPLLPSSTRPVPATSIGGASDGTSAAFTGVLDRVAATTTADATVPPKPSGAGLPGPKKGSSQALQPDESDTKADDGMTDPPAAAEPAGTASTLVDISVLAQAALNAAPAPAGSPSPVPPASQAVAPASLPTASGSGPTQPSSSLRTAGVSDPATPPNGSQSAAAQPLQDTTSQPAPTPVSGTPVATDTPGAQQAATATSQRPPQTPTQTTREQAASGSPAAAASPPGTLAAPTPDGVPKSSSSRPEPVVQNATATSSRPVDQATVSTQINRAAPSSAGQSLVADPVPAVAGASQSEAAAAVAPPAAASSPIKSGATTGSQPPAAASVTATPNLPQSGSDAKGSEQGDGKASKNGTLADLSKSDPDTVAATAVSVDAFAAMSNPAQQIMTALQSLGLSKVSSSKTPSAPAQSTASVTDGPSTPAATVKTLTLQLNPDHLGPVNITMRLQANTVEISIAVADPQTLHLLDRDRHMLTAAVEAAGGSRNAFEITGAALAPGTSDQNPSDQPQQQSQPGRQDGPSTNASLTGGQTQNQDRRTPSSTAQSDNDDATPTSPPPVANRVDGSLYL